MKTLTCKVIDLLQTDTFYGVSENVDIAKGKYKQPKKWSELKNYLKRNKIKW